MTCDSSQRLLPLIWTLVYDNLLSLVSFMRSHPLHLAYLLYFSPHILQLLSFLFPLLLTTSTLLLLFSLHFMLETEATAVCLLDQLASVVVATIGNVFEWEFEAMRDIYDIVSVVEDPSEKSEHLHGNLDFDEHSSLNCEVRGDQMELPLKNSEESKLLESDVGIGDGISSKSSNFDTETPSREPEILNRSRSMGELSEISDSPRCDVRENSPELSLEKSKRSEVLESHSISFVPQTPDRISEILANSSLVRQAKQRGGASESLSGSESMRITGELYKHSTLNCEVVQGPSEIFWECSEKTELSKSQSVRGRTPSIRSKIQDGRALESRLQKGGSMRKEKEWKRTLACKLYEERVTFKIREERAVVEGAEEMDLLWEAYEADADKVDKLKSTAKSGGKKEVNIEEDDEPVPQLCCLQALRISTGKMNLGVGRTNLAKISKAFKGVGFLHRSSSRSRRSG